MAELLPQSLSAFMRDDQGSSKESKKQIQKHKVTTITTWVECFATYIYLVFLRFPERVPDLLAYMSLIVHAARQYQQDPWRIYNTTFRQQAVANKDWKWAQICTSRWTMALTNVVPQLHCTHCLSLDHTSVQCPENEVTDKITTRKRANLPHLQQVY